MKRALRISTLALATAAAGTTVAEAQQTTLTGQVRPRTEITDFGTGTDAFTSMRTRIGLEALIDQNLSIYVEAQDVRIWGEETSTRNDFSADGIDVHQAYLRYNGDELDWLTATIGRQVTWFGGERLVGQVNWSQQGQVFDGVRLDVADERGSVALIGYTIADLSAGPAFEDRQLYGAYATRPGVGPGTLDAYWLFDRARAGTDTDQHAIGARWAFDGEIDGRLEATYQLGTRADTDVAAFMFGARIGTAFADGRARATLWYDYLSGDDPTTPEVEVFSTLYATGHKFYGLADVFTNIPAHTGGAGLQDIAAKLSFSLRDDLTGNVDVHTFRAAESSGLSSAHFADELDLSLMHRYSPNFSVLVGFSYVVQDDPLAEVGRLGDDFKWFYVMFDASF